MCHAHRRLRAWGALAVAVLMMSAAMFAALAGATTSAAEARTAASTTLCKGFARCADTGRDAGGYDSVYRSSFWNMRAGHNCTNYVAYRLTHGRLVARPPGANDAGTWGAAARKAGLTVDRTPSVGDVAYWRAGYHGASKGGHVAYVEAVRPDGSIVISEDHLGGTFMWRVLSKNGRAWPSGFIQLPESDGSPAGRMLWVRGEGGGKVRLSATSNEPDVGVGARDYLVTVGGPRGTAGVETFTFSTSYFRFERLKTLRTRGRTTVFVYALNTPGTAGADVLLGRRSVTLG